MTETPSPAAKGGRWRWEMHTSELPMPKAPTVTFPMCWFHSFIDDVEGHYDVVGYYEVGERFIVRDFYGPDAGIDFPLGLLLGLSDTGPGADAGMTRMSTRDWVSHDLFFACRDHAKAVEADPRFEDRPARPAPGESAETTLLDAFFACRTSGLIAWSPPERAAD